MNGAGTGIEARQRGVGKGRQRRTRPGPRVWLDVRVWARAAGSNSVTHRDTSRDLPSPLAVYYLCSSCLVQSDEKQRNQMRFVY